MTAPWKPTAVATNNGDFIGIESYSGYALMAADPEAPEHLLNVDTPDEVVGAAIVEALENSRALSLEEARNIKLKLQENYKAWIQRIMEKYGYKTKRALFKNMKSCGILRREDLIIIKPSNHEKLEGWSGDGISTEDYVRIPADSSLSEIGAALRLGFERCK